LTDDRALAQRLELSGLGYVNLLHIAVTLAAIPGADPVGDSAPDAEKVAQTQPVSENESTGAGEPPDATRSSGVSEPPDARETYPEPEVDLDEENETVEDSFFPADLLHATVVIEEPEAHLHPQLQRGLITYLRRTVRTRPEVQVIVTTHSSDIITSCDPTELVVLRREADGTRVHRLVRDIPLPPQELQRVHRMTALHFDASRTATFLAERVVLVEGITDALLLRQLGRAWAGTDQRKSDRVEALTIVPVGTRVGEWPIQLLATPNYELVQRVAILSDTDHRPTIDPLPAPPAWLAKYGSTRVRRFLSHPTLEPSITPGNEELVGKAFAGIELEPPPTIDVDTVDDAFRRSRRKAEFAYALAGLLREAIAAGSPTVTVPPQVADLFDFIFAEPSPDGAPSANP